MPNLVNRFHGMNRMSDIFFLDTNIFVYCFDDEQPEKTSVYSFYDALILAGANRGGCTILYSEDLTDGQIVDQVRIVNPFLVET
jgi:predicted nucleic acid-binding protein